jgi:hypothetical protein
MRRGECVERDGYSDAIARGIHESYAGGEEVTVTVATGSSAG